jgi:hypothetical protein
MKPIKVLGRIIGPLIVALATLPGLAAEYSAPTEGT